MASNKQKNLYVIYIYFIFLKYYYYLLLLTEIMQFENKLFLFFINHKLRL